MRLLYDNGLAVVLDACVLVPMPLCDTLLRCAEKPALFRVLWSEETLEEVSRTLRKMGRTEEQAVRRIHVMQQAFPEASVSFPISLFDSIPEIPDLNDRHVIAAAIHAHANVIVTLNLRDFPEEVLEPFGIEVRSPDAFLSNQYRLNPDRIVEVIETQASRIRTSQSHILERLEGGLPDFVDLVRRHLG
jgi:predicted nucleic acid-binding protein